LNGKQKSKSSKVKICNSFFNISARRGPTPFRYSMGLDNIDDLEAIFLFSKLNQYPFESFEINLQDG
jgi:hypothetical protein